MTDKKRLDILESIKEDILIRRSESVELFQVIGRPHQACGYGKTLRDAIDDFAEENFA